MIATQEELKLAEKNAFECTKFNMRPVKLTYDQILSDLKIRRF